MRSLPSTVGGISGVVVAALLLGGIVPSAALCA
jgi:hypothetical protein